MIYFLSSVCCEIEIKPSDGDLSDSIPFLETYDEDESAIDILPEEVIVLLYKYNDRTGDYISHVISQRMISIKRQEYPSGK